MEENTSPRPGFGRRMLVRGQTATQLIGALCRGPFWWLVPFCLLLLIFAVLLIVVQTMPAAAPFLYALF